MNIVVHIETANLDSYNYMVCQNTQLNTINLRAKAPSDGNGSCLRRRSEAVPSSLAAEGG